jgi:2-polyprenyl-3-methyl-5-hydroxy-6-metoxy-1,4-benzoquinol methylase
MIKNSTFNDYYFGNQRSEIFEFLPEKIDTILDVGCGYGGFLQYVKSKKVNIETWGLEIVESIGNTLPGKIDKVLIGPIEIISIELPITYFDAITFNDVLEHLLEPEIVLKSIASKLTLNGCIVASLPNVRYIRNLYNLIIRKDWKYEDSGILDKTHLRFFTKKSMERLFEESGYQVITIKGIFRLRGFKFWIFNLITFGFFDDCLFERFVIVAKPI